MHRYTLHEFTIDCALREMSDDITTAPRTCRLETFIGRHCTFSPVHIAMIVNMLYRACAHHANAPTFGTKNMHTINVGQLPMVAH